MQGMPSLSSRPPDETGRSATNSEQPVEGHISPAVLLVAHALIASGH
jgi:hypothetical protein